MRYSSLEIANALIEKAKERNIKDLTPMKLQRLMFFAQSKYVKSHARLLIRDNFERWDYGAVIPIVYFTFQSFSSKPIGKLALDLNAKPIQANLSEKDSEFLDNVLEIYGKYDDLKLSKMSRQKKTAWRMGRLGTVIAPEEMIIGKV